MFASLSQRFDGIISSIRGKALISEDDLEATLRDIRVALLEADVALIVVKKFISEVKADFLGKEILKNILPDPKHAIPFDDHSQKHRTLVDIDSKLHKEINSKQQDNDDFEANGCVQS